MSLGKKFLTLILFSINMFVWYSLYSRWSIIEECTFTSHYEPRPPIPDYNLPDFSFINAKVTITGFDLETLSFFTKMEMVLEDFQKSGIQYDEVEFSLIFQDDLSQIRDYQYLFDMTFHYMEINSEFPYFPYPLSYINPDVGSWEIIYTDQTGLGENSWRVGEIGIQSELRSATMEGYGWYPFEIYSGEFFYSGPGFYPTVFDQMINDSGNPNVTLILPKKELGFKFTNCPNDFPGNIQISQTGLTKLFFIFLEALIIIFSFLLFLIPNLSSLLEVAVALLLGLWGIRQVLIPSNLPYDIAFGAEQVIVLNYIFLGSTILLWLFDRGLASNGASLFQSPPNLQNNAGALTYWTTKETANFLNISEARVRRMVNNDDLPGIKIKGHWHYDAIEIQRKFKRNRE